MPDLIPGLEDFWAPGPVTPETLEREAIERPRFSQGRPARYPVGVIYHGPWETMNDGVCIAVRRNACALRRQNLPVFLSSLTHTHWNRGYVEKSFHHELPPSVLAEVDHLTECQHDKTIARVLHFVPTTGFLEQQIQAPLGSEDTRRVLLSRTLAYMALEYDKFPADWVRAFNLFGRIAVPCEKNKRDLEAAGVVRPIDVIPHSMALRDPIRTVKASWTGGTKRFLHVGKWEPRKNQHGLLGGFLTAFCPTDDVHLTLHCKPFWGAPNYPTTPDESRHYWLEQPQIKQRGWDRSTFAQHVTFQWAVTLTREELVEVYRGHHAYVSCARAEGFDLCAFDAKVAGHLLVHVGHGGTVDYASVFDVLVPYTDFSSPPEQYNAPKGTRWPNPTHEDYAVALRKAYEALNSPVAPFDSTPYKLDAVGKMLLKSIFALVKEHDIPLPTEEK